MMATPPPRRMRTLGLDISIAPFTTQVEAIVSLARERISSYVCCVNAHMTVEAWREPSFAGVVNAADLATPDGMPVVKSLHWLHGIRQERVAGNDLMPAVMGRAQDLGISVFLLGGKEDVLKKIQARAAAQFERLSISGALAPPFRPWTEDDLRDQADRINASGAGLVLVSLGCPKQEKWMASMRGRVNASMVGVGGAFLLYAGEDDRAPKWMRDASLEWFYRLWLEPQRLWKRYLVGNTMYAALLVRELVIKAFR